MFCHLLDRVRQRSSFCIQDKVVVFQAPIERANQVFSWVATFGQEGVVGLKGSVRGTGIVPGAGGVTERLSVLPGNEVKNIFALDAPVWFWNENPFCNLFNWRDELVSRIHGEIFRFRFLARINSAVVLWPL